MARIRNLASPNQLQRNEFRLRRRERPTDLQSASVSNGETRFNGNESLKVFGSAVVYGWLIITGTLKLVGNFVMEGILTATGAVKLNGPVEITQTLDVSATSKLRGALELLADLVVKSGGKITIDGVDPMLVGLTSAGRPGIQFASGAQLVGTANGIQLNNPTGNGFVTAGPAVSISRGTNKVEVSTIGITLTGDVIANLPLKAGAVANVHRDSANKLWRTS